VVVALIVNRYILVRRWKPVLNDPIYYSSHQLFALIVNYLSQSTNGSPSIVIYPLSSHACRMIVFVDKKIFHAIPEYLGGILSSSRGGHGRVVPWWLNYGFGVKESFVSTVDQ